MKMESNYTNVLVNNTFYNEFNIQQTESSPFVIASIAALVAIPIGIISGYLYTKCQFKQHFPYMKASKVDPKESIIEKDLWNIDEYKISETYSNTTQSLSPTSDDCKTDDDQLIFSTNSTFVITKCNDIESEYGSLSPGKRFLKDHLDRAFSDNVSNAIESNQVSLDEDSQTAFFV